MAVTSSPPAPPTSLKRVNSDGTPTQAQLDYERAIAKWVADQITAASGGALPFPTPTTLGGIKSLAAVSHKFLTSIGTDGLPVAAQPSAGDISGLGPFATASSIAVGSITGLGALATLSSVDLASQVTGDLAVSHLNGGIDASGSTFWRGDGIWAPVTASAGGSSGQIQFNNAGSFGGFTVSGDGSLDATTGLLTVTKTNGSAFAAIATSGSASDIGTGTLALARGGTAQTTPLAARSSTGLNIESGTGHGNSDYSILATDRWVYTNAAFTASRTWTLPAASSVNAGGSILIDDLQNTLTATNTLTIARAGSDLINSLTTFVMRVAGCRVRLISDGTSKWTATLTFLGATGSGSVVLSDSPTFSGIAIFATVSANAFNGTTGTITTLHSTTFDATTATIGTLTTNNVSGSFAKLTNTSGTGQLALSGTGNDEGGYVFGASTNAVAMSGGATLSAGTWTAKATTANILFAQAGNLVYFADSGLTIGSTFTPTARFEVDATGAVVVGSWAGTSIGATVGGTGQSSYTIGDLLYASGSTALSKLAAVAVGKVLRAKGTSTAPAWEQVVLTTDVTGTLPVANGGTGDTGTGWTAYTPTITATSGTFTTVSAAGSYKTLGKTTFIRLDVTVTTNGTAAAGVIATLPNSATSIQIITGREVASTGKLLQGLATGGNVTITNYDNTYPAGSGTHLFMSGSYEST